MASNSLVNRFDHVEIATASLEKMTGLLATFGFFPTQKFAGRGLKQSLLVQGKSRILVTEGSPDSFQGSYVAKHGDGVCSLGFATSGAQNTWKTALSRGAVDASHGIEGAENFRGKQVSYATRSIRMFGDVRGVFVERSESTFDVEVPFLPGFETTAAPKVGAGLLSIDHLTNNVEMGQMEHWADYYKTVFGFEEVRYFDIKAQKTGLLSKVLQSSDGGVKIPVNEATEAKSQVQEFVDQHKGPGVQHIALTTTDIVATVQKLRASNIQFLSIPGTYYEDVPKRLKRIDEDLTVLEKNQVLVDGDDTGYLLQIFTQNQIGPLFFEIIQRKGHNGFGEGNFRALFEAIERDQERRGVL